MGGTKLLLDSHANTTALNLKRVGRMLFLAHLPILPVLNGGA
jgi:hypothetical protein